MSLRALLVLLVAPSVLVAAPALARELAYQNFTIGERAAAMGGAFVAMTGDATLSFYNPAGLAAMRRRGISASASVYQASMERYGDAISLPSGLRAGLSSSSFYTFPSSLAYTYPLDEHERGVPFHHVLSFSVLVPDFDNFDGQIGNASGAPQWDVKGAFRARNTAYWLGPSYAVELWGRLRLGASLFLLAHLSEYSSNIGLRSAVQESSGLRFEYNTANFTRSGFSISMLTAFGAQFDITDKLTFGVIVRPPSFGTFYSRINALLFRSYYSELEGGAPAVSAAAPGYADRVETDDVREHYKLQTAIGAGLAYQQPSAWAVSLDAWFFVPQAPYHEFTGPVVYPLDPLGEPIVDPQRALDPNAERKSVFVTNLRLGGELWLGSTWLLRGGFYTNFSSVDLDFYAETPQRRQTALVLPDIYRLGFTLGLGKRSRRTTSSFIVSYVHGSGGALSLNELFEEAGERSRVTSHTITFVLAGSAEL